MGFRSGTVTVGGDSPAVICAMGAGGALVYAPEAGVLIGGPDVAAHGDEAGVPLPPGTPLWVPGAAPFETPVLGTDINVAVLYGITAGGDIRVSFAAPQARGV